MGTFYHPIIPITILLARCEVGEEVGALVNTGATYLWLLRPLLEQSLVL